MDPDVFSARLGLASGDAGIPHTTPDAPPVAAPAVPYRGIQPFRYADHPIFFARERETRLLASLVDVYRGVFLYGDSGNGKSSLLNAGLLPQTGGLGFEPVRVRVQPRAGEELVIEQIAVSDDGSEVLPCVLAPEHDFGSRIVMSLAEFERRVRATAEQHQPLLVFDQFEEILTLFDETDEDAIACRHRLAEMLVRLLREPLPVKLLFAFREDYLGRVKSLLSARPELVDQALRLGAPSASALETIIRGPFERFPRHFERELDPALTRQLRSALAERFGAGEVSLSEVQTVCLRLWRSSDPAALLADKGVQGLLEDELGEALDAFPADLRAAAIALLSQMVTSAGTRNVISAEDLRQRVLEDDADIAPPLLDKALERLERDSKLVRRERRRDLYLYEITSEFLVPWISRRREELRLAHARQRERRRMRIFGSIAGGLLALAALVAMLALWALDQRADAQRRASEATSLALAASSGEPLAARPDVSLALAFEAYRESPRAEARSATVRALLKARRSGLRAVLAGHGGGVRAIAFLPDGTVLASGGDDDTVRLWDPVARTERGRLKVGGGVRTVAFSPDGKTLATAGDDASVHLWDLATRKQVARLRHHSTVDAVAFSPDGTSLAFAGTDGTVRLGNRASGKRLPVLGRHRGRVTSVAFSPNGKFLASAGDDATVRLWNPATREQIAPLHHGRGTVSAVAFSPDGRTLASAALDGNVWLWDSASGERIAVLGRHKGRVTGVAFDPDGGTLASSGDDGTVRLWDRASRKQLAIFSGHDGWIYGVAFSPDGKLLASAGDDKTVRTWNPATRASGAVLAGHKTAVWDLAFGPGGKALASAGDDGTVRLWSPAARTQLDSPGGHEGLVYGVAFSPDGKSIASAGFDGIVGLWNLATGRQVQRFTGHGRTMYDVAFHPDGRTIASAGEDGAIRVWRPDTGRRLPPITGHDGAVKVVAFSRDGRTLVSAGDDGIVRFWDSATHRPLGHIAAHTSGVSALTLSPDGRTVATAAVDAATVDLWNVATRRQVGRLTGHNGIARALAFSPDGRLLASAGEDAIVLWDPASRTQVARLRRQDGAITSVAFSPDGKTLASASDNGTVRVWDEILWRSRRELHAIVCDVLLGGLNASEWAQYSPGISYRRSCPYGKNARQP